MTDHVFAWELAAALRQVWAADSTQYVVFGSAVMKLHGLREQIGDVDVLITPALYARLRRNHRRCLEQRPRADDPPFLEYDARWTKVHLFYAWTARDPWFDVPECWYFAHDVAGVHVITLELVRAHKSGASGPGCHAKHLKDVEIIDRAIGAGA